MDLAIYIGELLKQQGSLTVPGLGKFSQVRKHGYYDDDRGIFHPPHYETSFEEQDTEDDTLSHYLSSKKGISVTSSEYFIEKYVTTVKMQAEKEEVAVDHLGWLNGFGNKLAFKSNNSSAIYERSFFGLPSLEVNKIWEQLSGFRRPSQPVYVPPVPAPAPATPVAALPIADSPVRTIDTARPAVAQTVAAPVAAASPFIQSRPEPPATPELGIFPEVLSLKNDIPEPTLSDTVEEKLARPPVSIWIILLVAVVIIGIVLLALYRYAHNAGNARTAMLLFNRYLKVRPPVKVFTSIISL